MTLSTRIAVMDSGRFLQVGMPKQVYEYPESRFVADFIGTINLFEGKVAGTEGRRVRVNCAEAGRALHADAEDPPTVGDAVAVAIRPEKIFITKEQPEDGERGWLTGVVLDFGYFGNLSLYQVRLGTGKVVQVSAQNRQRSAERFIEWDDEVYLSWDTASAILLRD